MSTLLTCMAMNHDKSPQEVEFICCLQQRPVQQDYFFFQRGVPFWKERGVIFTIRGAAQESEVNHDAEVW